jgi:hypothetical protein
MLSSIGDLCSEPTITQRSASTRFRVEALESIDERQELPGDPKIRTFGRFPETQVECMLNYESEPQNILSALTEFFYK